MLPLGIMALALLLLLTGCSQSAIRNTADPLAFLAPGSEMQLTRDLEIPAARTRIFFQRGKAMPKGGLDYYNPSCDLEVRELRQEAQTVAKDLFVIGRLSSGREPVVSLGTTKLADSGSALLLFGDRGPSIHRYYRVELHSSIQPNVMRLTCRGALDDYYDARFPNAVEIKLALGDIMVFLGQCPSSPILIKPGLPEC